MVGRIASADDPKGHIAATQSLDHPRGTNPLRPRPNQQGQQHVGVITGAARRAVRRLACSFDVSSPATTLISSHTGSDSGSQSRMLSGIKNR